MTSTVQRVQGTKRQRKCISEDYNESFVDKARSQGEVHSGQPPRNASNMDSENNAPSDYGTKVVQVEPLRGSWKTWDEFYASLQQYEKETFQKFTKRTSISIDCENKRRAKVGLPLLTFPPDVTTLKITYVCTHGVARQQKRESARKTTCRVIDGKDDERYRFKDCKVKFHVSAYFTTASPTRYVVEVNPVQWKHSHYLGEKLFNQYSRCRVIKDERLAKDAENLWTKPISSGKGRQNESSVVRPRVLVAASGSVATIKLPELVVKLAKFAHVRLVLTESSNFFLEKARGYSPQAWEAFQNIKDTIQLYRDVDEWNAWNAIGDTVLHIDLKDWADIMLLAPLSANTLAKVANGLSDNLLTCIARAWNTSKPFLFAPAMNTDMWNHPLTTKHIATLHEFGYSMITPAEKKLACGVVGKGALASVDQIVSVVRTTLNVATL